MGSPSFRPTRTWGYSTWGCSPLCGDPARHLDESEFYRHSSISGVQRPSIANCISFTSHHISARTLAHFWRQRGIQKRALLSSAA